jgi:hypothetical protein
MRRWILATVTLFSCLIGGPVWTAAKTGRVLPSPDFVAGCALPFAGIEDHHSIDHACTIDGDLSADAANQEQNQTKNNFCATGTPVSATWNTFKKLQQKTDALKVATAGSPTPFTYGSHSTLPTDRTAIRTADFYTTTNGDDVHEGTLVHTVAFLLHGAYSGSGTGESVNCGIHGVESADIHLALAKTKTEADECNSFTAEITPHFRPAEWLILSTLHKTSSKTAAVRIAAMDLDRPLRLTGQMMMDGSHRPCTPGHPQSPKRISVWEIHPVYAIDVCKKKSLSSCRVAVDTDWRALDVWLQSDEE